MTQVPPTEKPEKNQEQEFDTTNELWDRITDDIIQTGAPCLETIENLLKESCYQPAVPPKGSRD